jgi:hypothetical protein
MLPSLDPIGRRDAHEDHLAPARGRCAMSARRIHAEPLVSPTRHGRSTVGRGRDGRARSGRSHGRAVLHGRGRARAPAREGRSGAVLPGRAVAGGRPGSAGPWPTRPRRACHVRAHPTSGAGLRAVRATGPNCALPARARHGPGVAAPARPARMAAPQTPATDRAVDRPPPTLLAPDRLCLVRRCPIRLPRLRSLGT